MMKKYGTLALGVITALTLGVSAAQARLDLSIDIAPPAVREEVVPEPRHGFVWAPGYWGWHHGHHEWVAGHWIRERRGYHWVSDRWDPVEGHYRYVPGHWER
jgi:hypothetical protein